MSSVGIFDLIKGRTPWRLRRISRRIKHHFMSSEDARRSAKEVFTQIYDENRWGDGSSKAATFDSGAGSGDAAAVPYTECVNRFIASHCVQRVVDLGCGDFRVGWRIAQTGVHYIGLDVVERLIEHNQARFASDRIEFRCIDIIADELPDGDLCLIREVLQHLSNAEILAILSKLKKFRWVIVTEGQPGPPGSFRPNRDKPHGGDSRALWNSGVVLTEPPFNVPRAELLLSVPTAAAVDNGRGEGRIATFLIENEAAAGERDRAGSPW
jgi:2-polyprenyl-3-methyl-5-hydroxy-6-metoxy-1,4-benzoquinol methylase